ALAAAIAGRALATRGIAVRTCDTQDMLMEAARPSTTLIVFAGFDHADSDLQALVALVDDLRARAPDASFILAGVEVPAADAGVDLVIDDLPGLASLPDLSGVPQRPRETAANGAGPKDALLINSR
ncbi:MAG: hypothetical protein AAF205_09805, partial [Pseudomonadota bacterium]